MLLGYHCALIKPNNKLVYSKYLNAFIQSNFVRKYYELNASGSGQKYTLTLESILSTPILLPDYDKQGLEFDSVKVIISNEVEEKITHNIFYTAITRAKKKLAIYWTPETEEKVIKSFIKRNYKTDSNILKSKYLELKA